LIVGLLAVLMAFSAAPALAHAHGHGDVAVDEAQSSGDGAEDGVHHDESSHDPIGHSHPIGEDDYHDKASHSSLDFAHCHAMSSDLAGGVRAFCLPRADRPLQGIALSPPVPPPLR
jgi:hypothetical protein